MRCWPAARTQRPLHSLCTTTGRTPALCITLAYFRLWMTASGNPCSLVNAQCTTTHIHAHSPHNEQLKPYNCTSAQDTMHNGGVMRWRHHAPVTGEGQPAHHAALNALYFSWNRAFLSKSYSSQKRASSGLHIAKAVLVVINISVHINGSHRNHQIPRKAVRN